MADLALGGRSLSLAPVVPVPFALPAPRVKIEKPIAATYVDIAEGSPSAGVTTAVEAKRIVKIVAEDLPQAAFDSGTLLLELLRWKPRRKYGGANAYVHPAHTTPSGNGTFMRGGIHGLSTGGVVAVPRPTEWAVTAPMQVTDVTQGLFGFFEHGIAGYRTQNATSPPADQTVDVTRYSVWNRYPTRALPRHIAYAAYGVGRFAFRWSVVDPDDARSKRISGPMSAIIGAGQFHQPFIAWEGELSFAAGVYSSSVQANPQATWKEVTAWHVAPPGKRVSF